MNDELKITFCKHEIEKIIKILTSYEEESVDFEMGFEKSVLISSISKGIEEYVKKNRLHDIHVGVFANEKYRITSCSECVKLHYEAFGDSYKRTLLTLLQRYFEGDYGDMYVSLLGNHGNYERDKINGTWKGLYDTVYGRICVSMNTLKQISICHNFER